MGIVNWIVEAVKHPRELSTVFPSSPFLANTIADQLDFSEPRTIAELGPADGALTKPIVERMHPDSDLHLIEVNKAFCDDLREMYENHDKFDAIHIHNRGAEELEAFCEDNDIEELDYVVSGIPLTTIPDHISDQILEGTFNSLKPDGRYVQFQYSQDYRDNIEAIFGPIRLERVWLNILPAWVYVADKENATN
jgi:phosphatidylethanolamine/phosphatidyl-N-methylethanolamine N-methyltransferase